MRGLSLLGQASLAEIDCRSNTHIGSRRSLDDPLETIRHFQKNNSSNGGGAAKRLKVDKLELSKSPLQYLNTMLTTVPAFAVEHVGTYLETIRT